MGKHFYLKPGQTWAILQVYLENSLRLWGWITSVLTGTKFTKVAPVHLNLWKFTLLHFGPASIEVANALQHSVVG